jgi:hypothetical protein
MAAVCADALGRRCLMIPVPLAPAIEGLKLLQRMGVSTPIAAGELLRFREDVSLPLTAMHNDLAVLPRDFEVGLRQLLAEAP